MLSEAEICKSYREAKDKNKQIEILSDICLCDKQEIIDILVKNNCLHGIKPAAEKKETHKEKKTVFTKENMKQIEKLYSEGVPTSEIAEKLGFKYKAMCCKVSSMGLPKKYGRNSGKQKSVQKISETDAAYIKELETLLKEKDGELKAALSKNAELNNIIENAACDSECIDELQKSLIEAERRYNNLWSKYNTLKSRNRCGVVEVINDLELLTVLFASMKERLPEELLERITVRIEGMTAFLRREVDFVE